MISIEQIRSLIGARVVGEVHFDVAINKASSLTEADKDSIVWVKKQGAERLGLIESVNAVVLIVPEEESLVAIGGKILLAVENPRLAFIKVLQEFFVEKLAPQIHPTAFVHSEAQIDSSAYIGPFSYVGKSIIGANTVVHGNVHIYDGVKIGENVLIHSGTVVGADGFGFEKDEEGNVFKFPHIGGVVIEDNVEIGSNTCIDRGTLSDTILHKNCKIDNLVHIAHNVEIGEDSFIIANTMIGGSTKIGKGTWIAPSVSLMNGISIGDNTTIGMAALVTKSVPDGVVWTGAPARPLKEFISMQKKLKELL